jgi:hypothetical protein
LTGARRVEESVRSQSLGGTTRQLPLVPVDEGFCVFW